MGRKIKIAGALLICGVVAGYGYAKGYPDRFYLPISEPYGVHFIKQSLGEPVGDLTVAGYPEFCVLPAYHRTKDGKGTDYDNQTVFAHCNATDCIVSIEPRRVAYGGKRYWVDPPLEPSGSEAFCVSDPAHLTLTVNEDDTILTIGHGGKAVWTQR